MKKMLVMVVIAFLVFATFGCTVGDRFSYPPFDPKNPLISDDLSEIGYKNYSLTSNYNNLNILGNGTYTVYLTVNGDKISITTYLYNTASSAQSKYTELSAGMTPIDTNNGFAAISGAKGVLSDKTVAVEITGPSAEITQSIIYVILHKTKKGVQLSENELDKALQ